MKLTVKIPKANSPKFLLWIAFGLSIISETMISMNIIPDNNIVKVIQYIIILVPVGLNFINLSLNKRERMFAEEFRVIVIMIIVFGILSLYRSFRVGQFSFESVMQLIQIFLPFMFAFLMINLFTPIQIQEFMKLALVLTWIGYILEVGLVNFFDLSNYLSISFISSYSLFENSTYAEIASGLAAYFIYNRKRAPFSAALAILLNLLIFKRVFFLMILVLLGICIMKKKDDIVSERVIKWTGIFWCVLIFGVYFLYQPATVQWFNEKLGIDLVAFTMSRIYRLWYVLEQGFQSYGLGTTSVFINSANVGYLGYEFEMDFIRIMFELGPIAIAAFVFSYLKITRRNKYAFYLICLCFLNLLMANGLVKYWGWTMRIVTIALINNYDEKGRKIQPTPYKKNRRIRFII
ncbi:MAG: hypothetical protein E7B61_12995 [Clostridiales bacterium]|nr:hypothetical protein [Clostridiales bacterium]